MGANLSELLADLQEDQVIETVKERMAKGEPAIGIIDELQHGMELVGKRYQAQEYYLSELIMSADIFKSATGLLGDAFRASNDKIGKIVLGTVFEDIHDIGKDIVAIVLSCNGIDVIDLGVNVPIERFVDAVREHQPDFVGLSCLLTTAYDNMKATVEALDAAGLHEGRKILIGGGPVDETTRAYVKADAFCKNAQEAADMTKKMLGVN
ncbi:MAG: cobalamin-dependent protein [Thermacetogeniaceae bacterium]